MKNGISYGNPNQRSFDLIITVAFNLPSLIRNWIAIVHGSSAVSITNSLGTFILITALREF